MGKKLFILLVLVIELGFCQKVFAGEFLIGRMVFAGRPAALGDAYVGLANDLAALEYNPAGISFIKRPQVSAGGLLYYEGIGANSFSAGLNIKNKFSVGVLYNFINVADTARTGDNTTITEVGDIGYKTSVLSFVLGKELRKIRGLSAGVAIKTFSEGLTLPGNWLYQAEDEFSISATAFDFGIIYLNRDTGESYGLSFQNLGNSGDKLPSVIRLGGGHRTGRFTMLWEVDWQALNSFAENILAANRLKYGVGLEYKVFSEIVLRAGLKYQKYLDGTCGLGLSYKNFFLDYAFAPQIDLGSKQHLSLTVKF